MSFTSDTEDNHPAYVPEWSNIGSNYDMKPAKIKWDWTHHWSDLSQIFKDKKVPVTWFIRVDDGPIRGKMLDLFKDKILGLKDEGDEIGIHIHTFFWNQKLSKWIQTTDPTVEAKIVHQSLNIFERKLRFSPTSARMGWYTMSNEIMRALESNDLLVDSSAIPETSSSGKFGERDNIYNWSRAPNIPYYPSHDDYQSLGNMKILEIPISILETNKSRIFANLVNRLSGLRSLAKLLPLARRLSLNPHQSFYITPWWSSALYSQIIQLYCQKAHTNGIAFLVGAFHACDILDPTTGEKNVIFE
ncbi:MAG: hypothetical protein PVH12_07565, partial [Candidatus Bathyarchaeota archaeon]